MTLVDAKKKSTHPGKKSTPAHQKKASHRKRAQKSTMVLLKALTTIPASSSKNDPKSRKIGICNAKKIGKIVILPTR